MDQELVDRLAALPVITDVYQAPSRGQDSLHFSLPSITDAATDNTLMICGLVVASPPLPQPLVSGEDPFHALFFPKGNQTPDVVSLSEGSWTNVYIYIYFLCDFCLAIQMSMKAV